MSQRLPCPKRNGRYYNPHLPDAKRRFKDFLLWQFGYFDEVLPALVPADFSYPRRQQVFKKDLPSVTWINHTTFLIKIAGLNILTDPIWSNRCSPVAFCGPLRKHEAGIAFEELPMIDYVILSHDHYDHLDEKTILSLHVRNPNTKWIVPHGVKKWFDRKKITNVWECGWWENIQQQVGDISLKMTAVPAQHFSGRSVFDSNMTLWAGWVIEFSGPNLQKRLYFAGDTGYNPHDFKLIGESFPGMDLSLIPIGAYMPRQFMSGVHIDPDHAATIHKEVKSRLSVGSHWKTFHLSDEPASQPPYDLFLALQRESIDPQSFQVLDPGLTINW